MTDAPQAMTDRSGRTILYLTYDGLCDPIGQSQVLPYLVGTARGGHAITIISFEKTDRFERLGAAVRAICAAEGMAWKPQRFRQSPPYVAKLLDQMAMARAAFGAARGGFDLIHARSTIAGVVGLRIKQRFGTRLLFDMRGLWPDQRREGGRWPQSSLIGGQLYRRWKKHEQKIVANADHIVSLTRAGKTEIEGWASYAGAPISVIPCCADFELFKPAPPTDRAMARARLGISAEAPVLAYLGSVGTVYLLDQQLRLFDAVRRIEPATRLLFIGQDDLAPIHAEARRVGIDLNSDEVRGVRAERAEVPFWLGAADVGACFITPTYSSLGVSPTKLAEYLACGIPVIANRGVGDMEQIITALDGGQVLADFSPEGFEAAARMFFKLRSGDPEKLRQRARAILDLPQAVAAYLAIYAELDRPVEMSLR